MPGFLIDEMNTHQKLKATFGFQLQKYVANPN